MTGTKEVTGEMAEEPDSEIKIETQFCENNTQNTKKKKKTLRMVRRRAEEQWAKSTASSGRCRPQTLQRFLSLVFNSMLPACHSDLRSVPVIRTAFKAGPKQQSCLRGGRCRGGVMERGGGAHEPMRCTFKLTRGRYIFTFLLTLPGLIAQGDGGGGGGWEFCRSRLCFFFSIPSTSFWSL